MSKRAIKKRRVSDRFIEVVCALQVQGHQAPPSLLFVNAAGYRWKPFEFGGGQVTLCDGGFATILGIGSRTLGVYKKLVETGRGIEPSDIRDGTLCTKGISVHVWMENRIERLEKRAGRVGDSIPLVSWIG